MTVPDKLTARGTESLTDRELLAILTGDDRSAEALLAEYGDSLPRIGTADLARLRMSAGLGLKRAELLLAAAEFGRRIALAQAAQTDIIETSADLVKLFRPQLERLTHEECWAVYLTASNRIIERRRVSQGGVQGTVVDVRLIVKRALELLATRLVLLHNHPSGAAEASEKDKVQTEHLRKAAELFDIRLIDHLIIAREGYFSFLEQGLL